MRNRYTAIFFLVVGLSWGMMPTTATGQGCTLANYTSATNLGPGNFPHTNGTGITANVSAPGVPTLGNTSYSCNGQTFACTPTAWWPQSTTHLITITFSAPVSKFSVIINGTNQGEVFTFTSNNGAVTLSDYCTAGFGLVASNQLIDNIVAATGTLISANSVAGATSFTIAHNGTGSGSRLSFPNCWVPATPFGVTLDQFDAAYRPDFDDARLDWHSIDEQNFKGFEVEHSIDGVDWQAVGFVDAAGTGGRDYAFSHPRPQQGENHYRLRQIDLDGNYTTSEVRTIQVMRPDADALIFPNPNDGRFEVRAPGREGELELVDALGRVVLSQPFHGQADIAMKDAAPGVYWVRIADKAQRVTMQRLVIQ